jgi:hypothetical protein
VGGVVVVKELIFLSDNETLQLNAMMTISNFALDEKDSEEVLKLGGVFAIVPLLSGMYFLTSHVVCACNSLR